MHFFDGRIASFAGLFGLGLGLTVSATNPAVAGTLDTVKARGAVVCGTSQGVPGYSSPDDKGNWVGFDIDFCRAVAAAIFDDPAKARFVPLSSKDRFTALQSGEIDILPRTATWTLGRDTQLGLNFVAVNYYDGQAFIVRKTLGVKSVKELNGASICVTTGTTHELNLADYFRANKMRYDLVTFLTTDDTLKAYESGRCDVFTSDGSQLYAFKQKFAKPDEHLVLPEVISKEPLAPVVRHGDDQWLDIAKWTHFAMLTAEELGVTKANVDEMLKSENPEIKRLLGTEGNFGEALGLTRNWAYRIIKHIGNYGEVFDRNLGTGSRLGIERGLNQLWTKGGLQYAPPIR